MGFEQRIQERRFSALLESMKTAIAAGDPVAAQAALDEARELRPTAPELNALAARIAAIPLGESPSSMRLITTRTLSAAALLLFGVSLITGIDYMRSPAPSISTLPSARVTAPLALAPVASTARSDPNRPSRMSRRRRAATCWNRSEPRGLTSATTTNRCRSRCGR
jgi:hypothetical protein